MPIRPVLPLLALIIAASVGCSAISSERLARLEAAADNVGVQEARLSLLEDRVNTIIAGPPAQLAVQTDVAATGAGAAPTPSGTTIASEPSTVFRPTKTSDKGRQDYQRALAMLESGKPLAAMPMFNSFLRTYPADVLVPNAEYWLGECFYSMKQYSEAINTFKDVVTRFPNHPKAAAAMLKAGYSYALQGDRQNARFYWETLIRDFPDSLPADLARQRLTSF